MIMSLTKAISNCLLIMSLCMLSPVLANQKNCSYTTYKWNTSLKKAVAFEQVNKPYSELTQNEIDPITGCSVCSEDQVVLKIPHLPKVKVCKQVASNIERALTIANNSGQPIVELVGYRVGMTRGEIDADGNRTQFSNHSFGTAIDINPAYNGLYDNCIQFNSSCRLIKGGPWNSEQKESISADSVLVEQMRRVHFLWGGQIAGKQKDFMHFSLTGY